MFIRRKIIKKKGKGDKKKRKINGELVEKRKWTIECSQGAERSTAQLWTISVSFIGVVKRAPKWGALWAPAPPSHAHAAPCDVVSF